MDWYMLLKLKQDQTLKFFYIDRKETIEIHSLFNNQIFRYIHKKKLNDEGVTDRLFFDRYLNDSVPIKQLSMINEEDWRIAITSVFTFLGHIDNKLQDLIDNIKGQSE